MAIVHDIAEGEKVFFYFLVTISLANAMLS